MSEILTNPAKHAKSEILKQIKQLDAAITSCNGFFYAASVALTCAACAHSPLPYFCFGIGAYNGIVFVTQRQAHVLNQEKNSLLFLNASLENIEGNVSMHSHFRPSPLALVTTTINVIENHLITNQISHSRDVLSALIAQLKSAIEELNLIAQAVSDNPEEANLVYAEVEIFPAMAESCIVLSEPSAPSPSATK